MGFYVCTKTNIILARDKDMFLMPHYDSIFLEQHTILNRQVRIEMGEGGGVEEGEERMGGGGGRKGRVGGGGVEEGGGRRERKEEG